MNNFNEFLDYKKCESYAQLLLAAEVDIEYFCEVTVGLAEQNSLTDEALLNELGFRNMLGGISNLARGAAGVGNVAGSLGRDAGNAVGNAANTAGNWLGNKFNAAKTAVGNAANSVKQGVQAVGNDIGARYKQGANTETLKQASNAIQALQKQLKTMGYPDNFLAQTLQPLYQQVSQDFQSNQQKGHQIGAGMGQPQPGMGQSGQAV